MVDRVAPSWGRDGGSRLAYSFVDLARGGVAESLDVAIEEALQAGMDEVISLHSLLEGFQKIFQKICGRWSSHCGQKRKGTIKSQRNPRVRLTSERTSFAKQLFATKYSSLNLRLIATETNSEE